MAENFWGALEKLIVESKIVIDRPRGQPHPRYPELIYPFDYGYLEGTTAGDGAGIDIWLGSNPGKTLTGILCTLDAIKRDAEIKLLLGCNPKDVEEILRFQNHMKYLYIPKPQESIMQNIPESHHDLLTDEKKAIAYLATLMADGSPQVTPLWFNTDGEYILLNTVKDRVKDKNMRARPTVAICISDPDNAYRYLQVRGQVVETTTEGAEDHIDVLNLKYRGDAVYPRHSPDQPRVIHKVRVEKVDPH